MVHTLLTGEDAQLASEWSKVTLNHGGGLGILVLQEFCLMGRQTAEQLYTSTTEPYTAEAEEMKLTT